jgi:hypothetical protein
VDKNERARLAQSRRKKFAGPPKREPKPGERVALSLRMSPDLKRRLDAAAETNGRSQSQEAEFRLERSFDREALLSEALRLKYGPSLAGILQALANTILSVGFGHTMLTGGAANKPRFWPPDAFTDDPASLEVGLLAGTAFLANLWPQGTAKAVTADDRRMALVVAASDVAEFAQGLPKNQLTAISPAVRAEREAIRKLLTPEMREHIQAHATTDTRASLLALLTLANEAMDIVWNDARDTLARAAGEPKRERKS